MTHIFQKAAYIILFWSAFSACGNSKIVRGTTKPIVLPNGSGNSSNTGEIRNTSTKTDAEKAKTGTYSEALRLTIPKSVNEELVKTVSGWIGVPYKFGGIDKNGVDCSGFLNNVVREAYRIQLPRMTSQIYETTKAIPKKELKDGDLVFFKISSVKVSHAGIYLFDGYFVHASTSKGVMVSRLDEAYWTKYYVGSGRINR